MSRQPVYVVGIVTGGLFGVLTYGLNLATGMQRTGWRSAAVAVIGAVVFGVLFALFAARQRRAAGGVSKAQAVTDAIKAGRAPADAPAEEWRPLLERRRRQARLVRWLGPLVFGVFSALAVYLIVTDPTRLVLDVVFLVVFLGIAIWYPIGARRQLAGIDRVERNLGEAPAADGSAFTEPDGSSSSARRAGER
ncbi:hypothetical protein ABCS02_30060 [Microbacterium sp. X-17]|uniref:hypothetical protein n=1 Tax=Microbacterium sp. X-17 TaxID=3144404 RepID=UPI0031F4D9E5